MKSQIYSTPLARDRPAGNIAITDGEFGLFQNLILKTAGITLSPAKKSLVNGRLMKRLHSHRCASFGDYYDFIVGDRAELQMAIDLLTTNETYFFREPRHFDFLRENILRQHSATQPFRLWSAACSTGEETYSLAMTLDDCLKTRPWYLLGSDISSRVLERARGGHYVLNRMEGIPNVYLKRYCLKGNGDQQGTLLVAGSLRQQVEFRQINLNKALVGMQPFDVIFLRNVMIYFSMETKRQVVRRIYTALKPGGYLFIGHSESINGFEENLRLVQPSIYRKVA